jgi:hypothetical protein
MAKCLQLMKTEARPVCMTVFWQDKTGKEVADCEKVKERTVLN